MEAEGLSSVCSRPLSTRVSSASEGPLVCSKFLELSVRPSVHPSPLPQCSPPASPWSPSVCPLPSWLPITPSDPASGHPLDPVLWELRPRPTLAAPCLSAASLFFTTGLRPGYPLGLASRPWDPARPSRRGASSSLALFFPSLCVSPHLSPGWAWLQSPPSPPLPFPAPPPLVVPSQSRCFPCRGPARREEGVEEKRGEESGDRIAPLPQLPCLSLSGRGEPTETPT